MKMNGKQVRVAVIGLKRGMAHVAAFDWAEKAELRWVVDLNEELAKNTAAKYGCRWAAKMEDVLDDVDAVIICTPHFLHHEQGLSVIRAGKHVLIEKPLAPTREECADLLREADAHGLKLMIGMQLRFLPAFQYLQQALASGEFGAPLNVDVWQEGLMEESQGAYRASKASIGGGVLFSMGCHYLDLMLQLMGEPLEAIGVGSRVGTEWMEGEGTAQVVLTFANGAVGHLVSSWGMRHRATPAKIQVHTTKAVLLMSEDMTRIDVIDAGGRRTLYQEQPRIVRGVETKGARWAGFGQAENFVDSILNDTEPLTNGPSSMVTFSTIWNIYDRWERQTANQA
jgi:predicted dehydrogenase